MNGVADYVVGVNASVAVWYRCGSVGANQCVTAWRDTASGCNFWGVVWSVSVILRFEGAVCAVKGLPSEAILIHVPVATCPHHAACAT